MAIKHLNYKHIGGNIGNKNMICTTEYQYDEDTFEFKGGPTKFDGGEQANKEGHYTFESIKEYIESKGKTKLIESKFGKK